MKGKLLIIVSVLLLTAAYGSFWFRFIRKTPLSPTSSTQTSEQALATQVPGFDKNAHSATDPASLWVVVNKKHPLQPASFAPSDLVRVTVAARDADGQGLRMHSDAAAALQTMFETAKKDGITLYAISTYRPYAFQVNLYASYVRKLGQAEADKVSARPGHSEHQTGLALDIGGANPACDAEDCFGGTPEAEWLKANSYKFGYILRYTPDKVTTTGYASEPWHFRYVGPDLALEMHNQNIKTLEEFFGITGGDGY